MIDKKKFAKAMLILFESKLRACSEQIVEVWFQLLKDYPEKETLNAIVDLARAPIEFFNVGMVIERISPAIEARADKAWQNVLRSAQASGKLPITNSEARALSAVGGMMKLRDVDLGDLHWLRKEFIDAFTNLQHSDVQVRECQGLTGAILPDDRGQLVELPEGIKGMLGQIGKQIPKGADTNGN
jgi:hypothetical protein